jgi:hypothetical protein
MDEHYVYEQPLYLHHVIYVIYFILCTSHVHSYYLCIIFIHIGSEEGRPLVEYVVETKGNS